MAVQFGGGDPSGAPDRAKQMQGTLRSIVMREYRAVAADGSRSCRETEVRAPEVAAGKMGRGGDAGERETGKIPSRGQTQVRTDDELEADLARLVERERAATVRGELQPEWAQSP